MAAFVHKEGHQAYSVVETGGDKGERHMVLTAEDADRGAILDASK